MIRAQVLERAKKSPSLNLGIMYKRQVIYSISSPFEEWAFGQELLAKDYYVERVLINVK
ncbi:hypothetical protein ACFLJZ_000181 [Vibrio alginolyticus]